MNAATTPLQTSSTFTLSRVTSRADWDSVGALRYDALLRRGDIAENPTQRHGDRHDFDLHAMTFLLRRNGLPTGTTRTLVSAPQRRWPTPATEVFAREIETALGRDATFVEMGLTSVPAASQDDPRTALFHLFKAAVVHGLLGDADWMVTAVRENQIGFHGRMFNMQILSGPEAIPGFALPRVLMGLDFPVQMRVLEKRIPTLAVTPSALEEFEATGCIETGMPVSVLEAPGERGRSASRPAIPAP